MRRKHRIVFYLGTLLLCLPLAQTGATRMGQGHGSAGAQRLWYRQPAEKWVEALPIGNGRLAGMIFGKVQAERIQLNEDTVWAGEKHDRTNPEALKNLPEVR